MGSFEGFQSAPEVNIPTGNSAVYEQLFPERVSGVGVDWHQAKTELPLNGFATYTFGADGSIEFQGLDREFKADGAERQAPRDRVDMALAVLRNAPDQAAALAEVSPIIQEAYTEQIDAVDEARGKMVRLPAYDLVTDTQVAGNTALASLNDQWLNGRSPSELFLHTRNYALNRLTGRSGDYHREVLTAAAEEAGPAAVAAYNTFFEFVDNTAQNNPQAVADLTGARNVYDPLVQDLSNIEAVIAMSPARAIVPQEIQERYN